MAHECIECGGDCYCGGDLDDCHTHYTPDDCTGCGCEETVHCPYCDEEVDAMDGCCCGADEEFLDDLI